MTLTAERLREVMEYDPSTGIFTWRKSGRGRAANLVAGCIRPRGDVRIRIDGEHHLGNRLAWLYMTGEWPMSQVDHKDLNPSNNRWANLRAASNAQNNWNVRAHADSRTGLKGVRRLGAKWEARIMVYGRVHYLGRFATPAAAHAAYVAAAERLHGEFARAA